MLRGKKYTADWTAVIEFTKESGEVVLEERFQYEITAQNHFDELALIKWPKTYKGLTMNLSEFDNAGTIGSVRLVVIRGEERFVRRELYRKP